MGDDWCRMRVIGSEVELFCLVEEESEAFRAWAEGFPSDLHPYLFEKATSRHMQAAAKQRWLIINAQIQEHIVIEEYDGQTPVSSCHRMIPIGRNDVFPAEMRIQAYRTFLPKEIPEKLQQWKDYIYKVKSGAYRAYLCEWYLYTESIEADKFCRTVLKAAEEVMKRDNAWAVRLKSTSLLNRIHESLLSSKLYQAPRWSDWCDVPDQTTDKKDPRFAELQNYVSQLLIVQREWNRVVPSNRKLTYYPRTYEAYLDQANSDFLNSLFDWLNQCAKDGMGLYLSV